MTKLTKAQHHVIRIMKTRGGFISSTDFNILGIRKKTVQSLVDNEYIRISDTHVRQMNTNCWLVSES